jgi:hypothetical protein
MTDILADDQPVEAKDYLQELVGDGKKFKSPQDLAKGKAESDTYIKVLEKKLDQMRDDYLKLDEDYKARASLQELIDQQKSSAQQSSNNQPIVKDHNTAPSIDLKDIENMMSAKLQEHEVTKRQNDNLNLVKNKLIEHFGTKYQGAVKEQLADLGLSESRFQELAREAPTALLRTLGVDQPAPKETYQSAPRSSLRSDSFKPKGSEKRDWQWYQDLKQKDPNRYNDPQTNVQMMNDYMALGSDFETGDFHLDFNRAGRR